MECSEPIIGLDEMNATGLAWTRIEARPVPVFASHRDVQHAATVHCFAVPMKEVCMMHLSAEQ